MQCFSFYDFLTSFLRPPPRFAFSSRIAKILLFVSLTKNHSGHFFFSIDYPNKLYYTVLVKSGKNRHFTLK